MRRLYLPGPLQAGECYWAAETDAHHLLRVLRLAAGDELVVSDGHGKDFRAQLVTASRGKAQLKLLGELPSLLQVPLRLCVALAKGERYEGVIEKAAELGVARFTPVLSERCTAPEVSASRQKRWEKISREACALSGRSFLMTLDPPTTLGELVTSVQGVLFTAGAAPFGGGASILLVGPEGGFSPAEVELAAQSGWTQAGLGPRTLRVETAATVAVALALAQNGELR